MRIILLILLIASFLRFYGLNWDQGYHLHPDERMITMVADKIHWPDNLNPKFFAYGSLPIYLLKITGSLFSIINPDFGSYNAINLTGRFLSGLFDLGTVLVIYLLGKKVFNQKIGLLAAFFYTVSTLPIQLSHFYAVDTLLTFFITSTLLALASYIEKPIFKYLFFSAMFFGLSLSTKISAAPLIIPITLSIFLTLKPSNLHLNKLPAHFFKSSLNLLLLINIAFITFAITMPYALIDLNTFWKDITQQQMMTKDAFTFPYTLQYVGKIPYLYELKNIFFWGMGPVIAFLAFNGTIFLTIRTLHSLLTQQFSIPIISGSILNFKFSIILIFFWFYFLITGSFAIGFMRYMLPIYPLLCLFGAFFIEQLKSLKLLRELKLPYLILYSIFLLLLVWPLSFISIYSQPNTRVQASNWIYQNIPVGSKIAREHWDDGLPLDYPNRYQLLELSLYDSDINPQKWTKIDQTLAETDYIIIASNRLYTPLMKLTDCQKLPPGRCYTKTAQYYQQLFDGSLGFNKVAVFSNQPKFSIFNFQFSINDSSADESFTVYDHPKVMVFKKVL